MVYAVELQGYGFNGVLICSSTFFKDYSCKLRSVFNWLVSYVVIDPEVLILLVNCSRVNLVLSIFWLRVCYLSFNCLRYYVFDEVVC